MIDATLKTVHVMSIVVWIGGMVFAHFFLRPALTQLEPSVRLRLMHSVLGRFFQAVMVASPGLCAWTRWRRRSRAELPRGSGALPPTRAPARALHCPTRGRFDREALSEPTQPVADNFAEGRW